MLELVVIILAGLLLLDVAVDELRRRCTLERMREGRRDRAAMLATLERTGGRRPRA